jgi:uncharacterized protein (TIGR00645 family)
MKENSFLEKYFERVLWSSRYVVVLASIFSVIAAITLFIIGSYTIINGIFEYIDIFEKNQLLKNIIKAVDLYLIAVVLLIFGFGIYELFVSKIDIARRDTDVTILEVENIDELKDKIIKVIIMVLIVSFFEKILIIIDSFTTPQDMLYFAVSILALATGVFLIHKNDNH